MAHMSPGRDDMGRYGQVPKTERDNLAPPPPAPPYFNNPTTVAAAAAPGVTPRSRFDPRGWSLRKKIIVGLCVAIVIVVVIVGSYEGVEKNRYPNYYPLKYSLKDTYEGANFFDNFQYWSAPDPAQGFVHYLDAAGAAWSNLSYATNTSAIIKVDTTYPNTIGGRNSIRIQSKKTYNDGLFVFDILHSPYGCGTWPALWLADAYNWPTNGEIDVVEANNAATTGNQMTLHTSEGCTMGVKRKQTGSVISENCWNVTNNNEGCGVKAPPATYGPEFNANGGGVYAAELRDAGIRIWFFPRNSIPADISDPSASPDPSTWGEALADFPSTDCDIASHFRNQSIIANIDLCGQLGGQPSLYNDQSHCPGTCTDFVAKNPSAFTEAYWEFKSFKVYQAS
ncbi:hypothetical protein VTN77DRAFT_7660 [Rasamsonia byssochlamydoides]|uniref:uncharacterized protein n=1 Tax=Rasamsonia byssochlamydoides TaxID=89139 RepID=UPI003742C0CD